MRVVQQLELGDLPGHPFHGNQWTSGESLSPLPKDAYAGNEKYTEWLSASKGSMDDNVAAAASRIATRMTATPAEIEAYAGQPLSKEEFAANLIIRWGQDTSLSLPSSQALQKAVADELNVPEGSRYVKTDEWGNPTTWEEPSVTKLYEEHGALFRDFVRAQYEDTQEQLKAHGIDALPLYRGLGFSRDTMPETFRRGGSKEVAMKPVESWTAGGDWTARDFAQRQGEVGKILAATVPASRIFSLGVAGGLGASRYGESEVVVLASPGKVRVSALATIEILEFGDSPGHPFHGNQWTDGVDDRPPARGIPDEDPSTPGHQLTVSHVTSKENAASIVANGFDVLHGGGAGQMFGQGAYGSLPTKQGESIRRTMETNRNTATLQLQVTTHKPLELNDEDMREHGSIANAIASRVGGGRMPLQYDPSLLTEMAMSGGYDSIVWRPSSVYAYDDPLGGDQIVVFSGDQVKVLNPEAVTAAGKSEPVLIGLIPFLKQFEKRKGGQDFGDVEGHPFHGNQWTTEETAQLLKEVKRLVDHPEKRTWLDYWTAGSKASTHHDPAVRAIGEQLMKEALGKKPLTASVQQILELGTWDEDLHPRDSAGRFTSGGGDTGPSANKKQSAKDVAILPKYEDHLITETGTSDLKARIDTIPRGVSAWLPTPPSLNSTLAATHEMIDAKEKSGEYTSDEAALARQYTDWRAEASKASQGYAESPGNFDVAMGQPSWKMAGYSPELIADLDRSLRAGQGPNEGFPPRWQPENTDEQMYKAVSALAKESSMYGRDFDRNDMSTWTPYQVAAYEHAQFEVGLRPDDPLKDQTDYAQQRFGKLIDEALNPPEQVLHTSQLNGALLAQEQNIRDAGQMVQDRAAEIRAERGLGEIEDARTRYQTASEEAAAAYQATKDINNAFGLSSWSTPDAISYRSFMNPEKLTDEQLADYRARYEATGLADKEFAENAARDEVRTAELDRRESTFAALREIRDFGPGDTGGFNLLRSNDYASVVAHSVERYYPTDWIAASNARPGTIDVRETNGRGYYSDGADGRAYDDGARATIRYDTLSSTDFGERNVVMAHEFGHRMEYTLPEVTAAEFTFRERRTGDEQLTKLGAGYRNNEETQADDFYSPYVGKNYGNSTGSSAEVFTMGIQSLVERGYVGKPTIGLGNAQPLRIDQEHEQLILGILATAGRKS